MLNAGLDHHLQQQNTTFSRDMKLNLYVDNVISGGATEEEVVSYYKEAHSIMSSAKISLRSWKLNAIATEHGLNDVSQLVNMLGLRWNTTTDELSLAVKSTILTHDHLVTKREV